MTYPERVYGTGPATTENRNEDEINSAMIAQAWRKFTDPPGQRGLRYDKLSRAAFAWLRVDILTENSRHRGAYNMMQ